VRKNLYEKFISTGDPEYYRSYLDASYTQKVFSNLAKERKINNVEFKIFITTLKVNNAYYSSNTFPTIHAKELFHLRHHMVI
jgi:hypothetical protein